MNGALGKSACLSLAALAWLSVASCGKNQEMVGGSPEDSVGQVHSDEEVTLEVGVTEPKISTGRRQASQAERSASVARLKKKVNTRSATGKVETVTVAAGDTLWKIAARPEVYGSGWPYPLIYKANRDLIKDPNALEAGLVLKIPRDVPDAELEMAMEEAMTGQILDSSPLATVKPTPAPAEAAAPAAAPAKKAAPEPKGGGWKLLVLVLGLVAGLWLYMKRKNPDGEL